MGKKNNSTGRKGFTLIEAISVLAILAMIMTVVLVVFKPQLQIAKGQDSRRKADVLGISKALEDYLNDHPCYPEESIFADCGGTGFRPYLSKIPCDPKTKLPYKYERPDGCSKYAVYADLKTENLDITYGGKGNYVVTSPNYRLAAETVGGESGGGEAPTAVPTSSQAHYGCFSGECLPATQGQNCVVYYMPEQCYMCGTPENPKNECNP